VVYGRGVDRSVVAAPLGGPPIAATDGAFRHDPSGGGGVQLPADRISSRLDKRGHLAGRSPTLNNPGISVGERNQGPSWRRGSSLWLDKGRWLTPPPFSPEKSGLPQGQDFVKKMSSVPQQKLSEIGVCGGKYHVFETFHL